MGKFEIYLGAMEILEITVNVNPGSVQWVVAMIMGLSHD